MKRLFRIVAEDYKLFSNYYGDNLEPEIQEKMISLGWSKVREENYLEVYVHPRSELTATCIERTRGVWEKGEYIEGGQQWFSDLSKTMNISPAGSCYRKWRLGSLSC